MVSYKNTAVAQVFFSMYSNTNILWSEKRINAEEGRLILKIDICIVMLSVNQNSIIQLKESTNLITYSKHNPHMTTKRK